MSTPRNDGGPAFPQAWHPDMGWSPRDAAPGMTLRDWFAGQALAGFCAGDNLMGLDGLEKDAYAVADALLAERERDR